MQRLSLTGLADVRLPPWHAAHNSDDGCGGSSTGESDYEGEASEFLSQEIIIAAGSTLKRCSDCKEVALESTGVLRCPWSKTS